MRELISQDEDCTVMVGDQLAMRAALGLLSPELFRLGDLEPIRVVQFYYARRCPVASQLLVGR
jgi:hypothetical protein